MTKVIIFEDKDHKEIARVELDADNPVTSRNLPDGTAFVYHIDEDELRAANP